MSPSLPTTFCAHGISIRYLKFRYLPLAPQNLLFFKVYGVTVRICILQQLLIREDFPLILFQEQVLQSIRRTLRPELLNRLDDIVVFQPLTGQILRQVAGSPTKGLMAPDYRIPYAKYTECIRMYMI